MDEPGGISGLLRRGWALVVDPWPQRSPAVDEAAPVVVVRSPASSWLVVVAWTALTATWVAGPTSGPLPLGVLGAAVVALQSAYLGRGRAVLDRGARTIATRGLGREWHGCWDDVVSIPDGWFRGASIRVRPGSGPQGLRRARDRAPWPSGLSPAQERALRRMLGVGPGVDRSADTDPT